MKGMLGLNLLYLLYYIVYILKILKPNIYINIYNICTQREDYKR